MSNVTTTDFTATEDTYCIAHGGGLSFGLLKLGENLSTGELNLETFQKK